MPVKFAAVMVFVVDIAVGRPREGSNVKGLSTARHHLRGIYPLVIQWRKISQVP